MLHSKVEAKAIYVVKQACEHVCKKDVVCNGKYVYWFDLNLDAT